MILLYIALLIPIGYLHATVVVPGNQETTPPSFNKPISAKAYARATGTLYVGLSAGTGNYAISAGNRAFYGPNSKFVPIAQNIVDGTTDGVKFLTIANSLGNPATQLGFVMQPATGNPVSLGITNADGSVVQFLSGYVLDASGAVNQPGQTTAGIVGLSGNQNFLFAAVQPCGGNFGSNCNGGIAAIAINQATLALTQTAAQPGDGGIKAADLDPSTPAVLINNSPTITANTVDMYWDDQLQRLYVGIDVTSAGSSAIGSTCPAATGTCVTAPLGPCPTGYFPDTVNLTCGLCPSGGYYDPLTSQCQACPTGQLFDPATYACQTVVCPTASFFNPVSATCVTCPAGLQFDQNSLTCVTCPGGGYFSEITNTCVPCPAGSAFDPVQATCVAYDVNCPSGTFFYNTTCIDCPPCEAYYHFDVVSFTCIANASGSAYYSPCYYYSNPYNGYYNNYNIPLLPTNAVGPAGFSTAKTIINSFAGPGGAVRALPTASGARSVVVGAVSSDGVITFEPIAPDTAFISGDPNARMVGVLDVIPRSLTINKVRTMHTSTGPSYLIISGGDGDPTTAGNKMYALPLVDDPINNPTAQGTLADPNAPLVNYKFVTPAVSNAQLPSASQQAVQIGAGPLGILPNQTISDIDVIQDTVYVSINAEQSATSESGILYSQALFDQDGKIIRWTPWTRKAFPATSAPDGIRFFSVDDLTSKLWAVALSNVYQTSWQKPITSTTLPNTGLAAQLNAALPNAVTAVLDLDQSTRGFLSNRSRYALFAGNNEVVITRVSIATGGAYNSPQTVTTDYSAATNFLITSLPPGACQVQALEYSRQLAGTPSNYFFAGTQTGLYVYSNAGIGFDVASLSALNTVPFTTSSWQQVAAIAGSVIDIKTTGNTLYVLVENANYQATTLYAIPFATTVAAMFAPANIYPIAQTGTGIFSSIFLFDAIGIISTTSTGTTEQVVLATNNGLFVSTEPGGVQLATSQADAQWILLPNTNYFYNGINIVDNASIPVASPSLVWPYHLADPLGLRTFDQSILQQLAGTQDAGPFNFVPPFFNSIEAATNPAFATLPIISYYWSDGARRISIASNIQSSCSNEQLLSLPFNTIEWDVDTPDQALITDPVLTNTVEYYWIKNIGITGILLAGTNAGVVALQ